MFSSIEMIWGIGVDVVDIQRIKKILQRHQERFVKRILNFQEIEEFHRSNKSRYDYLAGRFAAKEAALKAIGTGLSKDFNFQDVWILNQENTGKPLLNISDKVIKITGNIKTWISISHTGEVAIAMVIFETGNDNNE